MSPLATRPVAAFAVAFLYLSVGCNSKDDSGTGPGTGLDNQGDIVNVALDTTGFVNDLLEDVRPLTQGDFSTLDFGLASGSTLRAADEITWNELEQAWILDVEQTETTADGDAFVDVFVRIRFLTADGTPQFEPDGLTESVTMEIDLVTDLHSESEGSVLDVGIDYSLDMAIAGLPDGPHPVDGSGAMAFSLSASDPGQAPLAFAVSMDWLMDVRVPADGGCPAGIVSVNVDDGQTAQVSFVAGYDGTPSMDWTLYQAGRIVESGSEILVCGGTTI
jgi:hypothetical protein